MFCPKCGNPEVVDIFCAKCLREQKPLVVGFKDVAVQVCSNCGRVQHHARWQENDDPATFVAAVIKEHVVLAPYAEADSITVAPFLLPLKSGLKVTGDAEIVVHGRASEKAKPYEESYSFPYEIQNTLCSRCSKLGTQYFEGTLQVRNETPDAKKFLREYLKGTSASVAKEERSGSGVDYYLTNKRVVEMAARTLQERFGGLIKSSAQLFSHNKMSSKDIYRVTWFIELPPFAEGDAVSDGEECLFVVERGKRIKFFGPKRGRYIFHEYKDAAWERLPVHETTISSVRPHLMVLHPETFQPIRPSNIAPHPHAAGENVKVVLDGNKVYLYDVGKKGE